MNKFAYDGAILVSIAVPDICRYCCPRNLKWFDVSTNFENSSMVSAFFVGIFSLSSVVLRASQPSL